MVPTAVDILTRCPGDRPDEPEAPGRLRRDDPARLKAVEERVRRHEGVRHPVKLTERARQLLLAAGVADGEAADAANWVAKSGLKTNPGTQALEDAACLVFLENEIGAFAARHAEYPREKFIDILRKTWRKMSPRAHELALGQPLPPEIADLVREAVTGPA